MALIKISLPVYKRNKWQHVDKDGKMEVSSDVDDLSDGYQKLKDQIDKLLIELGAENRLAKDAYALEREIQEKAYKLKSLTEDIDRATEHLESLKFFLGRLGVDPLAQRLTFDQKFLLQEASFSEVEVVGNPSEF
ncbi:MAG: hypothetical protein JGK12_05835 [Microcoleus sp. PH2017_01_SCD_O_A]|uniref:hypothetical protein n=1 Tax=unclassified Microcoleus TaxID=2642155 RepID=UPI001DFB5035|nr:MULTISPECIES: hypothetical protein [unclassified Microcoleus]MCC3468121.1 hypothetical protein [Microcoleus sp. PH2017_06_SFM_O_A]TAG13222.1 MAG: hypothetical protein EAZ39_28820 [Oscillatoriales cyanobacterium]MCC3423451.1 hypothetical protein [Microcoleus sp. PH2017_01_SCD_O_A]MCC3436216.1 hypothetical protein [Microcoleus sp. PH2017_05_CCC_O_A]MCC3455948.1 hypothetical protein [Microcoleus sp. PH2017_08_TRC_O_A]